MVDLTAEMAGLWTALGPGPAYRGRVIQFAAATGGEDVSTVAREFARLAAVRARRPVWLIDGDLAQQSQQDVIESQPERFGRLGQPASASPDGSSFLVVTPSLKNRDGRPVSPAQLLTARPCLGGRLWITRFRMESLRSGQRAEAVDSSRYWDAMRRHAEVVIVDSPAADRGDMALTLAPLVDATVLVVAETSDTTGPVVLREEIEAAGGRIAGMVMNRSRYKTPGFLRRWAG